jgi:hypothetical protein
MFHAPDSDSPSGAFLFFAVFIDWIDGQIRRDMSTWMCSSVYMYIYIYMYGSEAMICTG